MPRSTARTIRATRSRSRVSTIAKFKRSPKLKTLFGLASVVAVLTLSVLVISGWGIYRAITQNMVSAFSSSSSDMLNSDIYTVLLSNVSDFKTKPLMVKDLYLYVFDTSSTKVTVIKIDPSFSFDLPGNLSTEPLSKAMALGMMPKDATFSDGNRLLKLSVEKLFGYKVDRYVATNDDSFYNIKKFMGSGSVKAFMDLNEISALKTSMNTDLSLNELYSIYTFVLGVPSDNIFEKSANQNYLSSQSEIDSDIKDITFDSNVSRERRSVSILNGASVVGLASYGSRVLENNGGRVVSVNNTSKPYKESIIVSDDPFSPTVLYLQNFFNIKTVVSREKASSLGEGETDRSDITLIMGLDIADTMF